MYEIVLSENERYQEYYNSKDTPAWCAVAKTVAGFGIIPVPPN